MYSRWYFWFHKRNSRVEDQQGWNLGFVWCLLVIHEGAFGRNNRDPGQQSLFEKLVQYNAQSYPYQNGSCWSPKRSHQRQTVSVWRSSLWTDRWRCYGVHFRTLINKRLRVIHPWTTRKTSILLPLICWCHCNARFSNSNYFPAHPQPSAHTLVKFTMEVERSGKLPFLGTELLNHVPQIKTKVYVKPTNTGLLLHYQSHVDNRYKRSLLTAMLDRAHRLSSSWAYFSEECSPKESIRTS